MKKSSTTVCCSQPPAALRFSGANFQSHTVNCDLSTVEQVVGQRNKNVLDASDIALVMFALKTYQHMYISLSEIFYLLTFRDSDNLFTGLSFFESITLSTSQIFGHCPSSPFMMQ